MLVRDVDIRSDKIENGHTYRPFDVSPYSVTVFLKIYYGFKYTCETTFVSVLQIKYVNNRG